MYIIRFTADRSAPVRLATALVGGVAGFGVLVGCGASAVSETELESPSGKVSFDEDQVRREIILFENRRAAWAMQYAKWREEGQSVLAGVECGNGYTRGQRADIARLEELAEHELIQLDNRKAARAAN